MVRRRAGPWSMRRLVAKGRAGWSTASVLASPVLTFAERGFAFERLPQQVTGLCVSGDGLARQRYDAQPGTSYLIRPDRYVAARWRRYDPAAVDAAVRRATGNG